MPSLITEKNIEEIHEGQVRTFMVNNDFIPLNNSENLRIVSFQKKKMLYMPIGNRQLYEESGQQTNNL